MKLKFFRIYLLPLYIFSMSIIPTYAADGDLDGDFGAGGIVITVVSDHPTARALGVYIQADGRIVTVGNDELSQFQSNNDTDFVIVRYEIDGTVESIAAIPIPGAVDVQANGVAVQSDGKIVVVGTVNTLLPLSNSPVVGNVFVARLNDDLTLDTDFNGTGFNILPSFQASSLDQGNAVVIDVEGNIVVVGTSSLSSSSAMAIAHLTNDGDLDQNFNLNGQQIVQFAIGSFDQGFAVALEADGSTILAAGSSTASPDAPGQSNFAFVRLSPTGAIGIKPITLFSNVPSELDEIISEAHAVLVQPNGQIVLIGFVEGLENNTYFALARYNSNGTLDATFTGGPENISTNPGTVVVPSVGNVLTGETSLALAGALQSDGKIIAAGEGPSSFGIAGVNFMLARFLTNGALDTSFNGGGAPPGFVFTSIQEDGEDTIYAIALQGDGKIVAAGSTATFEEGFSQDFALARYLVDTPPTPLAPTVILTPLANESVSGFVLFSGTAQNPSIIDIFIDEVLLGSTVTIGATNAWSFTNTDPIDSGEHDVLVVARYRDDGHVNLAATIDIVCTIEASDLLLATCASTPLEDTVADSVSGGTLPYSFAQVGAAVNGTLVLNTDGTFIFTPTPAFVGDGSFQYQVSDSGVEPECLSNIATVTIAVEACCPPIDPTSFFGQLISFIPS